jgi:AcrR family transcriptional regulator
MTTAAAPTRRERQRSATLNEIKQTARRLVVEGGPTAISLRAIARDLGMSAAALYRYFPSLEALVAEVCADIYDELRDTVTGVTGETGAAAQLIDMARGFRRWSIAHPQEFALLFGTPVPGVAQMEEDCVSEDHPAARFGAVFMMPFARLWQELDIPPSPDDDALRERLAPMYVAHGDALPPAAMYALLVGWIRLYGLVALEVFGHLRWAVTDVEPLFEAELAAFVRDLAVG